MVDRDILLAKISQIQNCLKRIQDKTGGNPDTLNSIDIQDIFVLNLQRAIQSSLDLASHIVSDENLGLPTDLRENFVLLEKANVITQKLSSKLQKMVGFRNIAVHEYAVIHPEILRGILTNRLVDLEEFYSVVIAHFKIV